MRNGLRSSAVKVAKNGQRGDVRAARLDFAGRAKVFSRFGWFGILHTFQCRADVPGN